MALSDKLFASESGALYNAAEILADPKARPVRANYRRTHRQITSVADFKATLRAGEYAWPGGYPMFFVTLTDQALSFDGARRFFDEIVEAMQDHEKTGRRGDLIPVLCEVNYEDNDLYCDVTCERIESAYGADAQDPDPAEDEEDEDQ